MSNSLPQKIRAGLHLLVIIVAAPFLLVIMSPFIIFILCICVWAALDGAIRAFRLKRLLRERSRFKPLRECTADLICGRGTLIIESYTAGWGSTRVWWTPDDVPTLMPHQSILQQPRQRPLTQEEDASEARLAQWFIDNYTDPETGRALLVKPRRGDRLKKKILAQNPSAKTIDVWTAATIFDPANFPDEEPQ